jgi:hypothetical protein
MNSAANFFFTVKWLADDFPVTRKLCPEHGLRYLGKHILRLLSISCQITKGFAVAFCNWKRRDVKLTDKIC